MVDQDHHQGDRFDSLQKIVASGLANLPFLVELKNRLSIPVLDAVGAHGTSPNGASATSDVRDALGGLGYAPEEIREALRDIPSADAPTMLRDALKLLGARRA